MRMGSNSLSFLVYSLDLKDVKYDCAFVQTLLSSGGVPGMGD